MNKIISLSIVVVALAASAASAQTALSQLGAQAGVDAAPLAARFKAVRSMYAGAPEPLSAQAAAPRGQDVLAGCSALSAKAIMPWNLASAVVMTQTCLNHAYAADGDYQVRAVAARFGARACPEGPRSCKAVMEVEGIKLVVTGALTAGDTLLTDLDATLAQRGYKLFGFEVAIENQSQIVH